MRYVRQYVQETVSCTDAATFDAKMNDIYRKASEGGKEPDVHFFENREFCASVRYFVSKNYPESKKDEYELKGEYHYCCECPYFTPSKDRRVKYIRCGRTNKLTDANARGCDYIYEYIEGGRIFNEE